MELLIACEQSLEEFFKISMLQINCFILTVVLFTNVNCGIFTLRTFMLPGRKQSDAYSIYHVIHTDTCYLSLPDHHTYESIL